MSSSGITFESSSNSPPPPRPPPTTSLSGEAPPTGRIAAGLPKFKSVPPPSLPISQPALSPSSYFSIHGGLSPADLLDSPVLLSSSNILSSPTTGSFPFHAVNWKPNTQNQEQGIQKEQKNFTDFSFQSQSNPPTDMYEKPRIKDDRDLVKSEHPLQIQSFSPEISTIQTNSNLLKQSFESDYAGDNDNHNNQSSQKKLDDGYNWRKYGQKQVKGSENPRSYYKCTNRNCSMRKKVERSFDGEITEIVYKGNHNHPKPQSTRRSSSSASNNSLVVHQFNDHPDQSYASHGSGQWNLVGTPDNSSISIGDDEFDQSSSQRSRSGGDEFDEDELQAKRLRIESENEEISTGGSRAVREPRVVVQTVSDIDILDDGYRWRKYGQKVVKGNPNPRSYYKCTTPGCSVRKHVERASHDLRSVITTYEGKHNHDVPVARGVGHRSSLPTSPGNVVTTMTTKPSEMSQLHPNNSMINPIRGSRLRSSDYQTPFSLEMLQSPKDFGFSGFENPLRSSYMDQQPNAESVFSRAKEEPKDDMFLESLLC